MKPECLRAVVDCGFEHPSEVQHECIPQAVLGMDIVCQAKSGMGKTAVFVLACILAYRSLSSNNKLEVPSNPSVLSSIKDPVDLLA